MQLRRAGPLRRRAPISALLLALLAAAAASFYVAGRLWQDARLRVHLVDRIDHRASPVEPAQLSVSGALNLVTCREQRKRLSVIETELAAAKQEGFVSKYSNGGVSGKRLRAVVGITTGFGGKRNRDLARMTWVPTGMALKKLEEDKGIIVRFVIGRSANGGDSLDRAISEENKHTKDFIILDNHVEASEELPKKMKCFFIHAVETWDAEFYAKVNDNVYVDIDALGAMLATSWDKPRVYIGCMKPREVISKPDHRWYEPDWWKFGNGKSYFLHASGDIYVISRALAQFISINRYILHTYIHDDVTLGSWMIGLDVKYVSEKELCCSLPSSGSICAAVQSLYA